ncbi:segregation/condensation protein A [Chloroflexia bacterium SDU3-3]|nr:segregation/condensation protein A [Chloroflexia bacterium SDU3-3]
MLITEPIDYTFQAGSFEGPLDLLLRLIEREELDITTIALAQVADQYLAHVRGMDAPNPASLSAFLVIAARLLLIKSRALLPRPAAKASGEAVDDAEDLVRQLREYQRFKQAAELLRTLQESGLRSYTRQAAPALPALPTPDRLDATLGDMLSAIQRRLQLVLPLDEPTVAVPAPKIITVPEMAARIEAKLAEREWLDFEDLLSITTTRVEVVVALWTVLELLKRRAIMVEQRELFGPIMVGRGQNLGQGPIHELGIGAA